MKDETIHQVYHHRIRSTIEGSSFTEFMVVVGEKDKTKQLVVTIYEISVKGHLESTYDLNLDSL